MRFTHHYYYGTLAEAVGPDGCRTLSARLLLYCCCTAASPRRSEALRCLSDVFAAAARPSRGGFVREALTASYPRLVALLEASFNRILAESRLKVTGGSRRMINDWKCIQGCFLYADCSVECEEGMK
jgi:hypothetical protein